MASVLVIENDYVIRNNLQEFLQLAGNEVNAFGSADGALNFLLEETPDLVILDLRLPGMDGLSFLKKVKERSAGIQVVVLTSDDDISTAVSAMKIGARYYIRKPFDLDELGLVVQRVLEVKEKDEQLAYLQKEKQKLLGFGEIVGSSKPIQNIFRFIRRVANSPKTTVLIRGETGTGKELVARAIHSNSDRANKPFIEINCSAFQDTLLEAELFGYEAGAFTDAKQKKRGLLEIAHEGTFFLDEIADMSMRLQSKILKVIENQTFRRVGGTKEIKIDIRIISATARELESNISIGTFRKDLYYRLNVASIVIPPLYERQEDVLLLAEHFLKKYNTEFKKNIKGMTPNVKARLLEYKWPGNVRELKNAIERAVLFENGDFLSMRSLRIFGEPGIRKERISITPLNPLNLEIPIGGLSLTEIEQTLIKKAITRARGNKALAARLLKISREALKYRIRKFKIES